ncbi:outer membrane protein [Dongshaea marina]|uniref:outer membrane protein n=1 Tax=Dongshaea marina TaxID=2047966 RepID=UPI00131F43E8|nr:outer membrane beta-barrel protein [Dongshaea marina]
MKKKVVSIAGVILFSGSFLFGGSAFAQGHPYVGVNIGTGGMLTPNINFLKGNNSHHSAAIGVNSGYLWGRGKFNYGAELGYYQYPKNHYSENGESLSYDGHNIDLMGVLKYDLSSSWSVFGKGGVAYVHQETTGNSSFNESRNKILPKIGLGVGYRLNSRWSIDFAYSYIFGDKPSQFHTEDSSKDDYNKVASVNMMTLGVNYSF